MKSRRKTGTCHICGSHGELSFEHVPPKSAFNDKPVLIADFDKLIGRPPGQEYRGRVQQKGAGAYTLCERCNSVTGKWYVPAFANWCYQAMAILIQSKGKPTLYYYHWLHPLRVIKQVLVMFFSANGVEYSAKHPELVDFVLNRDRKYLPPMYRIFVYYNVEGMMRSTGIIAHWNTRFGRSVVSSELSFPPFGYVQTFGRAPLEPRLFEISHFADYGYYDWEPIELRLPVLPTHSPFAGDYRNLEQWKADYARDTAKASGLAAGDE